MTTAPRPIIFSAPMVRALLDGRKTQTRRVLKPPFPAADLQCTGAGVWTWWDRAAGKPSFKAARIPYAPGDRLWVREKWSGNHAFRYTPPSQRSTFVGEGLPFFHDEVWYWADGSPEYGDWEKPRPSIHMPRWASRLTLTVTDVRVQQLQEISEADAEAEGVNGGCLTCGNEPCGCINPRPSYRDGFAFLWNTLHGTDAWHENPCIRAISFDVHRRNIDHMARP